MHQLQGDKRGDNVRSADTEQKLKRYMLIVDLPVHGTGREAAAPMPCKNNARKLRFMTMPI